MICFFLVLPKKLFFILGVAHADPFAVQIGPQKAIFRGFANFFFTTTGLQQKSLILIESANIFHWKSTKKKKLGVVLRAKNLGQIRSNVVKKRNWHYRWDLFIFCMRNTFKSKEQLQKQLSGNGRPKQQEIQHLMKTGTSFLPILRQKYQKVIIFEVFTLVSQS